MKRDKKIMKILFIFKIKYQANQKLKFILKNIEINSRKIYKRYQNKNKKDKISYKLISILVLHQ
jgi:hypothetical protein